MKSMKSLSFLLTSLILLSASLRAAQASNAVPVAVEPRVFICGRAVTNTPLFRIEGNSLTLNGETVWCFNKLETPEQRELAAETKRSIEAAVTRGDVLLFGTNYRIIKTGDEAADFLSAVRALRQVPRTLAASRVARLHDIQKQLRITAPGPVDDLEKGYLGDITIATNEAQLEGPIPATVSPPLAQSVDSVFQARPHHFAILRPCNFHFGGVLGNDNGGYVWNKLVAAGYSGEDYIDGAMTAAVFYDEIKAGNGNGVIFFQTHGANEGLVVETFRHSNYSPLQTTLTAPCTAGAASITVASTVGLPASGNVVIKTLLGDDLIWYEAKTATTLTGIPSEGDDAIGAAHATGDTVEWTQAQQAEDAAYNARSAYYDRPEFDYGDIEVASISANLIDPRPAYVLVITPQFIERNGALSNTIVYADACESAGCPDRSATELDDAFLAAGVENYLGYNVSASANWWLWWLPGNSPKMVGDFFDKITAGMDRKTVGEAHADIIAYQPSLIRCARSTASANQVLYYCGDISAQTIPTEGDVVFGQSYTFTVVVTNRGNYTEEYQVNLAVHNAQYQELATIIQGPINCPAHQSKTVSVTWPVDPAHGVVGAATYKIGIGLWPSHPDYMTEPIIGLLGYYTYTVRSLPSIPVTGRVLRQDNGQGLDGVSVGFSAGGGTVSTTGGGYFSNAVAYGWAGTVTPNLSGWQFTPASYTFSSPLTASPVPLAFSATALPVKYIDATPDAFSVLEGSSFGGLKVRLSENPAGTVVVSVQRVSGDADLNVTSGSSLTFNSSNWQTYQWVQVSANEDADKLSGTAVIRCSSSGWASKDVVASETDNDGGSVRVYIEPAEARSAGAQWRAQGGAWHNSGESDDTLPFFTDITVQYKDVSGWFTPPVQHATLNSITPSVTFTGTYNRAATGTGNVRININPLAASAAGGRWRVDSGIWMNSGDTVYGLAAGSHTVDFATADGYVKAANQIVNVNGGNTTENLAIYTPTGSCVYVSAGQSIQTAIDNATPGYTIILNDGTFNISDRILLSKGVTLRSLNGPGSTSVVLPGARTHCISIGHSNAVVDGITFRGADYYQTGQGGGAYCGAGMMLNCKAQSNIAGYGAGIYCGNGAVLYNCWVENNEAYYGGGGLYLQGNARALSCVSKNNTIRNDNDGGGFYVDGGYLYNCLVTGNGTGTYGDGAGGYARNAVVDRCVIAGNTAEDSGGGLILASGSLLDATQVQNNSARNAGGIYCESGTVLIRNCTITGNHATQANGIGGGGCWGDTGTVITNCTIAGNTSAFYGGGVASFGGFNAYDTVFSNNTAQSKGGAIYSEGNSTLVNCLVCRNSSSSDGGGIWNYTGSSGPAIINCTIAYNTASGKGGGIYSDGNPRALLVRNSIVMNNTATGGNANYFEWDTGDLRYEYSCTTPLPAGAGNINSSPLFVNAAANNFRLQSSSPCVDKGTSTGAPARDIEAIPRPLDGDGTNGPAYDMGAYEYAPPSGSIIVRIDPVYAVDAGARWSLDGTTWYPSELRVDYVPVGSRTITFTNVPGWSRPGPYTVTIVAGNVLATNGLYLALSDDTDGDELPDAWEVAHFGRLTNACFSSDFDGDKLPDYYEYISGTDPCDPTSCIIFNQGGISVPLGEGVLLRWYSGAGMSYRVCRTTNLVEGFQVIDPSVPATPPMNFYTDPNISGHGPFFYRIDLNP